MKKTDKKALTYVRPGFGRFRLCDTGTELSFRKFTVDDYAWVHETFGAPIEELTKPGSQVPLSTLCRLWFQALDEESKKQFLPREEAVVDYETGESKTVKHPGWKRFMQAIESWQIPIIASAFVATMLASKPLEEWSDDLKKSLELMRGEPLK